MRRLHKRKGEFMFSENYFRSSDDMMDSEYCSGYDCVECDKRDRRLDGAADCFEALQDMLYGNEVIDNNELHSLCDEIASYLKVKSKPEAPRLRRDVPDYLKGFLMDYVGGKG